MTAAPLLVVLAAAVVGPGPQRAIAARPVAAEIHRTAIVVDGHADTPQRLLDEGVELTAVAAPGEAHVDVEKARAGNLGAEFFSIWVDPEVGATHFTRRALQLIDAVRSQVERHPDQLALALTADDIVAARRGPKPRLAVLMGVEGGHALEDDLGVLRSFQRLGVRYLTLTWSNTNGWADSSGDLADPKVAHHGGLTPVGKDVVRELNRLGMMVDVSHVSEATLADALAVSQAPVIASHSSARALAKHPRNLTDDQLRAIARNGGVVMVNFFAGFLDDRWLEAWAAQGPERDAARKALEAKLAKEPAALLPALAKQERDFAAKIPRPPLTTLIDHLEHVAQVAGDDHVGIGSDFDGIPALPEGIDSAADLPKITQLLVERGWTKERLHKLLGGNLLRVMRACEQVRARATR